MAIVVIHGPMATGKTFHADKFKAHYGLPRAMDWTPEGASARPVQDDDLLLTTATAEQIRIAFPKALIIPIDDARRAIGLGPAPRRRARPPFASASLPTSATTWRVAGLTLPFAYEGNGQVVDAEDRPVCVVDPNGELTDNRTAEIADLIVRACNLLAAAR